MPDETSGDLSSPACSMHEASDAYMGYASPEELVTQLNELLAAERAGARVALKSRRDSPSPVTDEFFRALARDEASWCSMLARHIANLGGVPTAEIGQFYPTATAISETRTRLGFLNRGQGWVARRIKEMLPRVRSERLHADLKDMLTSHERNIGVTNALIALLEPTHTD